MKISVITLILISLITLAFAQSERRGSGAKRVGIKEFSHALNADIAEKLEQNPQAYETRPLRAPASVAPIEVVPTEDLRDLKQFKNQAVGRGNL